MGIAEHWDSAFSEHSDQVSWFQPQPETSLRLLAAFSSVAGTVVDVGAGESYLVDGLLDGGWSGVTVLDVSRQAVATVEGRLAGRMGAEFVVGDLLNWQPDRLYDAWHDRAVLHFLIDPLDQERYVDVCATALRVGGVAVLGTFASDGPTECSGLPTCRYDASMLAALFGDRFSLVHHEREVHLTPAGVAQPFTWVVLRRL